MDFSQIAQYLYDYSGIPATCFVDGVFAFDTMEQPYLRRLASHAPSELWSTVGNVRCFFTDEAICFGLVRVCNFSREIVFGPISTIGCDNLKAQRILLHLGLPRTEAGLLLAYFQQTPQCSYFKFAHFIIFANFVLNGEETDVTQLLPEDYTYRDNSPVMPQAETITRATHDAQRYESELFSMIRYGNREEMQRFLGGSSYSGNIGMLATDVVRHHKNLIIASITLAARCAVDGGVDYETAMTLADGYIQKVELAPDTRALSAVHQNMLKTYTRLVWEKKHNNANTLLSSKVHSYVEQHIAEKLSGQMIADALGINRSYLSSQFKKETGTNLNDFVVQTKLDESKRLLVTTALSISEISNLLHFTNQSYFQTLFKKESGYTPLSYRQKRHETVFVAAETR